jgi:hypothetical protein
MQTRREGLQANIFAFKANALQVVIGHFVRDLKADKESWRSAVKRERPEW